ncbi:hypothetical protein K438DRAFT_1764145 [Mycena galopus ATCC 62051]|nr:hypothetical protein K438DRAFT_1764145 [Mycena galopus ATCC 62051]
MQYQCDIGKSAKIESRISTKQEASSPVDTALRHYFTRKTRPQYNRSDIDWRLKKFAAVGLARSNPTGKANTGSGQQLWPRFELSEELGEMNPFSALRNTQDRTGFVRPLEMHCPREQEVPSVNAKLDGSSDGSETGGFVSVEKRIRLIMVQNRDRNDIRVHPMTALAIAKVVPVKHKPKEGDEGCEWGANRGHDGGGCECGGIVIAVVVPNDEDTMGADEKEHPDQTDMSNEMQPTERKGREGRTVSRRETDPVVYIETRRTVATKYPVNSSADRQEHPVVLVGFSEAPLNGETVVKIVARVFSSGPNNENRNAAGDLDLSQSQELVERRLSGCCREHN